MTEGSGTAHDNRDTDRVRDGLLPQSSAAWGHLSKEANVGLALLDSELRYVCVNTKLAEINGRPVESHAGRTIHEVVPELSEELASLCRRVIETGDPVYWNGHMDFNASVTHVVGVVVCSHQDSARVEQERMAGR